MAKKISVRSSSGTPFAVIFNSNGRVYDNTTDNFVDYDKDDWADYVCNFEAKGATSSSFYEMDFPDSSSNGKHTIHTYTGSAANETSGTPLQELEVPWDGEKIETPIKDLYHAEVNYTKGSFGDEYTVSWFKNGIRIETGIGAPILSVTRRDNGNPLFTQGPKNLNEISNSGYFRLNENIETIGTGEAAIVEVQSSVGGRTRKFSKLVSRDV